MRGKLLRGLRYRQRLARRNNRLAQREDAQAQKADKDLKQKPKAKKFGKKSRGKQPGAKGMWRTTPLVPNITMAHQPGNCAACNAQLEIAASSKPYMGYYVLELEKQECGFEVICQLHHYYEATCGCGHQTKARPGQGAVSVVPGRGKDLQLQEYSLVGPMQAALHR